jgi:endonuclease-3
MNAHDVVQLFEILAEQGEAPITDIGVKVRRSPFQSLVACLLSAQSRDASTKAAADALFARACTPATMLSLDEAEIARLIKPCGLYNTKAKNLKRLCAALVHDHRGEVPVDRAGLMALPGIGRKCADIMLRFVYGEPAIAVDTHVFRVARRLGLSASATERGVAEDLEARVPARFKMQAHMALLEHGKRMCRARAPRCAACPVAHLCDYARRERDAVAGVS